MLLKNIFEENLPISVFPTIIFAFGCCSFKLSNSESILGLYQVTFFPLIIKYCSSKCEEIWKYILLFKIVLRPTFIIKVQWWETEKKFRLYTSNKKLTCNLGGNIISCEGSYGQNSCELKTSVGFAICTFLQQLSPIGQTPFGKRFSRWFDINCNCSHSSVKVLYASIIGRYPVHLHKLPTSRILYNNNNIIHWKYE